MTSLSPSHKLVIIAGEVSGDTHGARLLEALRLIDPNLEFEGIGGDQMVGKGLKISYHIKQMAFMGLWEVLKHLPFIRKVFYEMLQLVRDKQPSAVVLIDYPGFNLRFAAKVKKLDIPVIYYISPQLWAWGKKRVYKIKKYVDKMLVLFPFERDFYKGYGIDSVYVGHPLSDSHWQDVIPKTTTNRDKVLGLLPGSRHQELEKLLPDMILTADSMIKAGEIDRAIILKVNTISIDHYQLYLNDQPSITIEQISQADFYNQLDVALVSSGTATLETAYFQVPMVIVYRVNPLTWILGNMVVKLKNIGLVNIVAGEQIAEELLQQQFTPEKARTALKYLLDPQINAEIRSKMLIIREKLGEPGASDRAARVIYNLISA